LILVSLGTHQQPFPRAIDLVEPLALGGEELVIQHGSTQPRRNWPNTRWYPFLEFDDLVERMTTAHSAVCHAGVGTIMTAVETGHVPLVIPRRRVFGEHVDDHQEDIARCYAERGLVKCVIDETELAPLLVPRSDRGENAGRSGADALREAVLHAAAGGPRRGRLSFRLR
jgi:UDP-N-acetylglucosamine transferase subunit ALG13